MSFIRFTFFLLVTFCLVSCQEDPITTDPGDLLKVERQNLGDILLDAIKSDASNISYYSEESFPDLYQHFNKLYRQVYQVDRDISDWDTDHEIKVLIIRNKEQIATCLPGGHLIISQGLANLFTYEYELIYVMAFEFNLMNEGNLLENMGQFVENITELRDLAKNGDPAKATEIALDILRDQISFEPELTENIDKLTVDNICQNTNFKVDGLREFYGDLIESEQWFNTRESFSNRINSLVRYMVDQECTGENKIRYTSKGENYYEDIIKDFLGN